VHPPKTRNGGILEQRELKYFNRKGQISHIFASLRCKNPAIRRIDAKTRHFCNFSAYQSENF
jgi:hypothetical protein|tara:strand:- start:659 stop:844 length:186 start_codon:yes stop_codon:yes gene_type:complete